MMPAIRLHPEKMRSAVKQGYATATDLADYLVRKGIPFRDAHEIVGRAVRAGLDSQRDLADLTLEELRRFSDKIDEDVYQVLTPEGSAQARDHFGGTAPDQVRSAIQRARQRLTREGG
jgi:argininosuccinate lyase